MRLSLTTDNRVRPLVWLLASAAAQIISFWYPTYVAAKNPSPDSRYFILPEVIVCAAVVAVVMLVLLVTRTSGRSKIGSAAVFGVAGVLGCIALLPVWRMYVK
jgi:FtsH-binding integral membrane protein